MNIKDRAGRNIEQVSEFKYLGSTMEETGGWSLEIRSRIAKGWNKWRECSGILCDKRMPVKLKLRIYTACIRPVLLYGIETLALRRAEEAKLHSTEMRMLRWIHGISLFDHQMNEDIRRRSGVCSIVTKARESRLRWFGHVCRREEENHVKKAMMEKVKGKRSRGRQRLRWKDVIERDMRELNVRQADAENRARWRRVTRAADPT